MKFMEKLLEGIDIKWKSLEEVANFSNGKGHEKDITEDGKYIVVNSKFISTEGKVKKYSATQICPLFINDILIVMSDLPNGKALSKTFLVDENNKYTLNQRIGAISVKNKDEILPKFLSHFLNRTSHLLKYDNGIDQTNLRKDQILSVEIPVPCPENKKKSLKIQAEIVQILDAFTAMKVELTAELTAELKIRKKQYKYYRDQLLSFKDGEVQHLPMGQVEIGEFIRGGSLQKKDFTETGVGCIHYGQIYTYYGTYADKTKTHVSAELAKKCRKAQTGNLVIATTSENDEDVCKAVAWLGEEEIAVSSDACIYKHNLNPKYVSYFFQSEQFQSQKRQYITGEKVRRVNADNLAKILIPVLSQEEQARIVSILDKFDVLTSSISEGLLREIELRQKQYDYYRDLLLSFPKPDDVEA